VHIRVGFRVLRGKFFSLRACGACTLPASKCDFGAWSVEAKLACLSAQNTQHTLPASPNTHLGAPPPHSPSPTHISRAHCSWTSTPSAQLPHQSCSKGSSISSPSRHHRCRIASVSGPPAFASIARGSALHLPRPLMLLCCQPPLSAHARFSRSIGPLLTHKQCIKTSPSSAITHCRYTRAPGYLSSFDQHT
jgi:hypothetical protein